MFELNISDEHLKELSAKLYSARLDIEARDLITYARLAAVTTAFMIIVIVLFANFVVLNNLLFSWPLIIASIPGMLLGAAVFGIIAYVCVHCYPDMLISGRARAIDLSMYEMVMYLYAMHNSGASLTDAIKSLAKYADFYGEAAKEFRLAVIDTEFCGADIYSGLAHLTETTPSVKLKHFVSEYSSTYRSIGSVDVFLQSKLDEMHEEKRIQQKAYLSSLEAVAEMYITLFVAGPLFVVIVLMVIGMISQPNPTILAMVVYLVLPIGTVVFLLLVDTISQMNTFKRVVKPLPPVERYTNLEIVEAEEDEAPLYDILADYDKNKDYRKFVYDPIAAIREKPSLSLYVSIPLALLVWILLMIFAAPQPFGFERFVDVNYLAAIDDFIVIAVLVAVVPYAVFYEMGRGRLDKVDDAIPDFSRQLGSSVSHGLTLTKAIDMAAEEGRSFIEKDIKMLNHDIQIGERLIIAMRRFAQRLKSTSIDRMVILISETEHFAYNISGTLFLIYAETKDAILLRNERKSDMSIYTIIIYISFLVFMFVQIVMACVFIEMMTSTGSLSVSSASISTSMFPVETYRLIIYHSVLIHGFCSGLMGGMMGCGDVKAGLKHSCIMLAIGGLGLVLSDWMISTGMMMQMLGME